MKLHNSLTEAMAKYAMEQEKFPVFEENFNLWQDHWLKILTHRAALRGSNPNYFISDSADSFPVWNKVCETLGHLWATNGLPKVWANNNLEAAYLQEGLARWGDWGYNPPLTYEYVTSMDVFSHSVYEIVHRTRKQLFRVSDNLLWWELTTTGGIPVAKATWYFHHDEQKYVMDISSMTSSSIVGRPDRLEWLQTWVGITNRLDGVVLCCDNVVAADSVEEWAEIAPQLEQQLLERANRPRE